MRNMILAALLACLAAALPRRTCARSAGPGVERFRRHAPVPGVDNCPDTQFAIAFDVASGRRRARPTAGSKCRAVLNMHVARGVKQENIRLAVVVHGKASFDLLSDEAWAAKAGGSENWLGQTDRSDAGRRRALHPLRPKRGSLWHQTGGPDTGRGNGLSAMTAHALLQQHGYTVNPF